LASYSVYFVNFSEMILPIRIISRTICFSYFFRENIVFSKSNQIRSNSINLEPMINNVLIKLHQNRSNKMIKL